MFKVNNKDTSTTPAIHNKKKKRFAIQISFPQYLVYAVIFEQGGLNQICKMLHRTSLL